MTLTVAVGRRHPGNVSNSAFEGAAAMRRVAPAFALYFLSPFVAEYLLGDFTVAGLAALLLLGTMYGGGAILIRETVRRAGRGWPTIVTLALAYGVLEEGLITQSLFNPNYAHHHLLAEGFVPALGIAVPWTVFVLALHTVRSISVPIALVEGLVPARRTTPWLKTPGLIVATVLFLLGSVLVTAGSYADGHFWATWPHLLVVLVVVAALIVIAFRLPTIGKSVPGPVNPWLVLATTLVGGVVFMACRHFLPAWLSPIVMLADFAVVTVLVLRWARRTGWGDRHRLALAAGPVLTYAGNSFLMHPIEGDGPVITPVSHVVFAAIAVALLLAAARRNRPQETATPELARVG
jgi:hypothetical protein